MNQHGYGKTGMTAGFCPLNESKNRLERVSNRSGKSHYSITTGEKLHAEFEAFFLYYFNNQRSYEQTETTIGFSMSKRFKNHFDEGFNSSCGPMYRSEKDVGQNPRSEKPLGFEYRVVLFKKTSKNLCARVKYLFYHHITVKY